MPKPSVIAGTFQATRDPFRVFLFLLTILTISRIHQQFKFIAVLRPALVFTAAAVIYVYMRPDVVARRPMLATWPAKVIALFSVLACLSAVFGISFGSSATFILNFYLKTIVFALLLIAAVRSTRDLKTFVWAMIISTAFLCYTTLFVFKISHYKGYDRLSNGDTYDANDLGLVLLIGAAFALLGLQTSKGKGKIFCSGVLALAAAGIAKTGSRGAFLGLLAVGLALLFMLDRVSVVKRVAFVVVAAAALVIGAPPGYWKQMNTITSPEEDYNYSALNGRRQIAIRGIGYTMAYPIFGVGIHNFGRAECSISDKAEYHVSGTGLRCTPPHNAYLETAAETGIPGFLLWMFAIPGGVIQLLALRRRMPRRWAHGDEEQRFLYMSTTYFAVALVGYSVGSFFLSFAWTDVTYFLFAIMAALWIAVADRRARDAAAARGIPIADPGAPPAAAATHRSGWRAAATAKHAPAHDETRARA